MVTLRVRSHFELYQNTLPFSLPWRKYNIKQDRPSIKKLSSHVVQSLSHVWLFATPWTAARQAPLSFTISQSLLTHVHWVGDTYNHFVLCHSLLLLPSMFPSIRGNELTLHTRWPMYWSFSFNTSPSNEYSGLISFRMDWLDLLAVLTCWHLTLVTLQEVCLLLNSPAFILFCPWPRWPFSSWNLRHLWYSLHYFSLKGERN